MQYTRSVAYNILASLFLSNRNKPDCTPKMINEKPKAVKKAARPMPSFSLSFLLALESCLSAFIVTAGYRRRRRLGAMGLRRCAGWRCSWRARLRIGCAEGGGDTVVIRKNGQSGLTMPWPKQVLAPSTMASRTQQVTNEGKGVAKDAGMYVQSGKKREDG